LLTQQLQEITAVYVLDLFESGQATSLGGNCIGILRLAGSGNLRHAATRFWLNVADRKATLSESVDSCFLYFRENVGILHQHGPQSLLSISSFSTDVNRSTFLPHIKVHASSRFVMSAALSCDIWGYHCCEIVDHLLVCPVNDLHPYKSVKLRHSEKFSAFIKLGGFDYLRLYEQQVIQKRP
jgi:hypothetical protein